MKPTAMSLYEYPRAIHVSNANPTDYFIKKRGKINERGVSDFFIEEEFIYPGALLQPVDRRTEPAPYVDGWQYVSRGLYKGDPSHAAA